MRPNPGRSFALFLVNLFLLLCCVAGMTRADRSERWALLIGINQYEDRTVPPLSYAVADVEAVAERLIKSGYKPDHVVVMSSAVHDNLYPTRPNILHQLDTLAAHLHSEDKPLIYFSGHGFSKKDDQYLATADVNQDDLSGTAVSITELSERLFQSPVAQIFFVIDACRNEATRNITRVDPILNQGVMRRLTEIAGSKSFAVLFACSPKESSIEEPALKHGVFTHYFLQGLGGRAANNHHEVTVASLSDYVSQKVAQETNNIQTPWQTINGIGNVTVVDKSAEDKLYLVDLVPSSKGAFLPKPGRATLTVNNKAQDYEHSVTFTGSVTYAVPEDYSRFEAWVGSTRKLGEHGPTISCKVIVDGEEQGAVSLGPSGEETGHLTVDVKDKKFVVLSVTVTGEGDVPDNTIWWGDAGFTNGGDPLPPTGGQFNIAFLPKDKLEVRTWSVLVDHKLIVQSKDIQTPSVSLNVSPEKHTIGVRWQGGGFKYVDGNDTEHLYNDVTVTFDVPANAKNVEMTAKVDVPYLGRPKLVLKVSVDGTPVRFTRE